MKAAVYTQYGPPEVVRIEEVTKPAPKADEVLVKVYASSVSAGDSRMRGFTIPTWWEWLPARIYLGIRGPKRQILGMQLAGEVEEVGAGVTGFRPGDAVFGSTFAAGFGGHAEYKCLPAGGALALKPVNMTFEEAAAVPTAGMGALNLLKRAEIRPRQSALIYGASGAVGTFGVQLAKAFGAQVTAVCSAGNFELVKSLGADEVIDYRTEDFTRNGVHYDVIFDAVHKLSAGATKNSLTPGGHFLTISKQSGETAEELETLKELIEAGKVRAVIDRTYPLAEIVEAYRYVDSGHKKGNVVITVR